MKDLIRSPLQFIRPMTDTEWHEMMSRADHRERQRIKRRQRQTKTQPVELSRRLGSDRLTRSASPASL